MSALVNVIVLVTQAKRSITCKALSFEDTMEVFEALRKEARQEGKRIVATVQRDGTLWLPDFTSVDTKLKPTGWMPTDIKGTDPYTYVFAVHSEDNEQSCFKQLLEKVREAGMFR